MKILKPWRIKHLKLQNVSVLRMLHLEEAIFRGDLDSSNIWLVSNQPPVSKTIVMGISGGPSKLLDVEKVKKNPEIKVLQRFSGGGTVIIDENTIFVSIIGSEEFLESKGVKLFPRPIMRWTEGFYKNVFKEREDFRLEETDYVFGDKKFGGNAQAISRRRFVHHTSFLWDFNPENMNYLLIPPKQPTYRQERNHLDFICKLKNYIESSELFLDRITRELQSLSQSFEQVSIEEAENYLKNPEKISSFEVNLNKVIDKYNI